MPKNSKVKEPIWILDEIVLAVHRRQLAEHGGGDGIRDKGLLASALNKPKNLYHYSDPKPTITALAASYAFAVSSNHAFVDGNKRTAFIICQLFLELNGYSLTAEAVEKYDTFIKLAASELLETELEIWISKNSVEKP